MILKPGLFIPLNSILSNTFKYKFIYKTNKTNYKAVSNVKLQHLKPILIYKYYKVLIKNFINYYLNCNNKIQLYKLMLLYIKSYKLTINFAANKFKRIYVMYSFLKLLLIKQNLKINLNTHYKLIKKQYIFNKVYNCFSLEI